MNVAILDKDEVLRYWPVVGPWLALGSEADPDFDAKKCTDMILKGETQVWIALEGTMTRGAIMTTVRHDGEYEGEKALDIHGLGGTKFREWSPLLAEALIHWARENECHRIIFHARSRAAERLYKDLGPLNYLGTAEHGHHYYERMIEDVIR